MGRTRSVPRLFDGIVWRTGSARAERRRPAAPVLEPEMLWATDRPEVVSALSAPALSTAERATGVGSA